MNSPIRNLSSVEVLEVLEPLRKCAVDGFNGHFQGLLASRLLDTGRPVSMLTLAELSKVIDDATAEFNAGLGA